MRFNLTGIADLVSHPPRSVAFLVGLRRISPLPNRVSLLHQVNYVEHYGVSTGHFDQRDTRVDGGGSNEHRGDCQICAMPAQWYGR